MTYRILSIVALTALCALTACAKPAAPVSTAVPDDLDMAIRDASDYLNENIPKGSKIVILNVKSDYADLSDYVIDELIANAVNDKIFSVVDRAQLEAIRTELKFQLSGDVDDNSALEIGKFLGAQTIVSGAISELADRYRMRIRALNVQTAEVQGQYNRNMNAGKTLAALTKGGKTTPLSYGGGAAALGSGGRAAAAQTPAVASSPAQPAPSAAPAQPAPPAQKLSRPKSGTYTFFPRLQPYQGATVHEKVYLWKVVVRGEYMSIYLTRSATGNASDEPNSDWRGGGHQERHYVLQDLDNPALSWNPSGGKLSGYSWSDDGFWFNFKDVTATRFSFTDTYINPPSVFEEIDLTKAQVGD